MGDLWFWLAHQAQPGAQENGIHEVTVSRQ